MKTESRTCHDCGIILDKTELPPPQIPTDEEGIPIYYISKIIMKCSNNHPNECEVYVSHD